jgi:hypothetical protein
VKAVMWIIEAEQQPVLFYLKGDASHSVDFPATKMNNNTTTSRSNIKEQAVWVLLVMVLGSSCVFLKSSLLATNRINVEEKNPNHWIFSHLNWDRLWSTGPHCQVARRKMKLKTNILDFLAAPTITTSYWLSRTEINQSKPNCHDLMDILKHLAIKPSGWFRTMTKELTSILRRLSVAIELGIDPVSQPVDC